MTLLFKKIIRMNKQFQRFFGQLKFPISQLKFSWKIYVLRIQFFSIKT